uniref:Uncharacterized protein n=1 Tax=uncultured Bacillota bacterium TaxID=344338 RepID=A0A650EMZ3_9FIRM|nr:hypothetical protein Firmicute1046_0620 [uncultured Firmicutes bacterium]
MRKLHSLAILLLLAGVIGWYGVQATKVLREGETVTVAADGRPIEEYYDHQSNCEAVRRIGEISGVNAAAVLNRGKDILVGITADETSPAELEALAAAIINEEFGADSTIAMAVGGGDASDVMELSYYLQQGLSATATDRRFDRLFRKVQQKQAAE